MWTNSRIWNPSNLNYTAAQNWEQSPQTPTTQEIVKDSCRAPENQHIAGKQNAGSLWKNIPQELSRTLIFSAFYLCTYSRIISSITFDFFLEIAISLGFTGNPVVAKLNNAINCQWSKALVFNAVSPTQGSKVLASQQGLAQFLPYRCFQKLTFVVKLMILIIPYSFTGNKGATIGVAPQEQLR